MSINIGIGTQTAAAKSSLIILATATIRPRVQRVTSKNIGAVTLDSQIEVLMQRITTAGTSTAYTPGDPDPNDPASIPIFGSNASAEPTVTANTVQGRLIHNPRGQDLWQAYDRAAEIILPAIANNGMACLVNTLGGAVTVVNEATVQT